MLTKFPGYLFFYQVHHHIWLNTDKIMYDKQSLKWYAQLTTPELLDQNSQWHVIRIRDLAKFQKRVIYIYHHLDIGYYIGYYYNQTRHCYDLNINSLSNQKTYTQQKNQNQMMFTLTRQNIIELYQQLVK